MTLRLVIILGHMTGPYPAMFAGAVPMKIKIMRSQIACWSQEKGFSLHLTATPDNVEGHPFQAANNIKATMIFGGLAFIAIAAGSQIGSTLVAAGLLAHTVWDVIHLRARAIVAPSLAEWCAVLDTLIAVGILVLVWR
jgi:hypothetical protein